MNYKNSYIILLVALIFVTQACKKDFLELEPKQNLSSANAYKTETDAFLAVVAVYDALAVQNWQFVPIISDIYSDDAFAGGSNAGDMKQWHEIELNTMIADNATALDLYSRCYSGIYRANIFFDKLDGITFETEGLKERLTGEVKFLRAYFYWDIVRHYGTGPLLTKVLGFEDYKTVPQSGPDELFKQIASDLLDAIELLPDVVASSEKGRATKYAAEALLARIYLYHEGFAKVVLPGVGEFTNGETVINKSYVQSALEDIINDRHYKLLDSYADVFDWGNENNDESIFEWQYSEISKMDDWGGWGINGNFSIVFYGPRSPKGDPEFEDVEGWSFCTASWSLVNEFEAGDPRLDVSTYDADANLTSYTKAFQNTGYFMKKHMGRAAYLATDGDPRHNWAKNYIDIRYADVLLMAAELFLDDNPTKALGYLNEVRARALGDGAKLLSINLDAIYHERRVELAGEGSRKWDLLRRGLSYAQTMINASFNVTGLAEKPEEFTGRLFKADTWGMFPIPSNEIQNAQSGLYKQFAPAY